MKLVDLESEGLQPWPPFPQFDLEEDYRDDDDDDYGHIWLIMLMIMMTPIRKMLAVMMILKICGSLADCGNELTTAFNRFYQFGHHHHHVDDDYMKFVMNFDNSPLLDSSCLMTSIGSCQFISCKAIDLHQIFFTNQTSHYILFDKSNTSSMVSILKEKAGIGIIFHIMTLNLSSYNFSPRCNFLQ